MQSYLGASASEGGWAEPPQYRIDELTAQVAARDKFIAFAAHELRNPMTPIIGQIDFLLTLVRNGRCSPVQIEQKLVRIQHIIRHYMKRAGMLLDVSRITSGKLQLELEAFDLTPLVRDVVDKFAHEIRYANVPVFLAVPDSLPGVWDRLAVEQIMDNLVSNAIRHGGQTPIHLSVEQREETICLQVRDHGGGVSEHERNRVLGRFEQAVGRDERHQGYGIGLWVVHQLVDAMGGTMVIEDAAGGGALFIVILPQHVEEARA